VLRAPKKAIFSVFFFFLFLFLLLLLFLLFFFFFFFFFSFFLSFLPPPSLSLSLYLSLSSFLTEKRDRCSRCSFYRPYLKPDRCTAIPRQSSRLSSPIRDRRTTGRRHVSRVPESLKPRVLLAAGAMHDCVSVYIAIDASPLRGLFTDTSRSSRSGGVYGLDLNFVTARKRHTTYGLCPA